MRGRRSVLSHPAAAERRDQRQIPGAGNDTPGLYFVGRLASYKYYNMDQVVGAALKLYAQLSEKTWAGQMKRAEAVIAS